METLDELRRRIESAENLLSVVRTMKTLSAANINQYERAVVSLEQFNRSLELAFHVAMSQRPSTSNGGFGSDNHQFRQSAFIPGDRSKGKWGIVIFGSDQGLCGQFNERITTYALDRLNGMHIRHDDRIATAVGVRAAERLQREGQVLQDTFTVPGSVEGIVPVVQELLVRVAEWQSNEEVVGTLLFFNKATSRFSYAPRFVQIFPIDPEWLSEVQEIDWPSHRLPVLFMEWEELFRRLNRQYFFVTLYNAMAESLASEHAARLSSMQMAEQNIEEHLENFSSSYQRQRQKAITDELLDIVSGFEALS